MCSGGCSGGCSGVCSGGCSGGWVKKKGDNSIAGRVDRRDVWYKTRWLHAPGCIAGFRGETFFSSSWNGDFTYLIEESALGAVLQPENVVFVRLEIFDTVVDHSVHTHAVHLRIQTALTGISNSTIFLLQKRPIAGNFFFIEPEFNQSINQSNQSTT